MAQMGHYDPGILTYHYFSLYYSSGSAVRNAKPDQMKDEYPKVIKTFNHGEHGSFLSRPDGVIQLIRDGEGRYAVEIRKYLFGFTLGKKRYSCADLGKAEHLFTELTNSIVYRSKKKDMEF
ncbi:MAG: hypothetical protein IIB95_01355 [Candidatus Marinimicrobia bacterium]|nr:hypothetical protein [Candidatus Neomarinimicrobiota bacterium]MCH7762373.1 hypothetical protein [Candidatus Neomarinimicrobiota bacterium]